LEYTKFNVNGFERIMKLGLPEVEMTQTVLSLKPFSFSGSFSGFTP
jgi:hypothetical protein